MLQMVEEAKTIAVLGHIRPDGDCVGSCLAVCNYLKEQYPDKTVQVYLEKPPVKFGYQPESGRGCYLRFMYLPGQR